MGPTNLWAERLIWGRHTPVRPPEWGGGVFAGGRRLLRWHTQRREGGLGMGQGVLISPAPPQRIAESSKWGTNKDFEPLCSLR